MPVNSTDRADAGREPDPPPVADSGEPRLFIPAEARPAVVADLASTAWQVAAALEVWETTRR
jgi:hypothetical protein